MMLTRENGEPLEPLEGPLDRAERERDEARAQRDALADALRGMIDLHRPYGQWRQDGQLDEVVAARLDVAHNALAALEEEL